MEREKKFNGLISKILIDLSAQIVRSGLHFGVFLSFIFFVFAANAQSPDSVSKPTWNQNLSLNFYIYENDFYTVPVYEVNKDHLHLEAHYNYEAMNTFSAWYGYNFKGGKKLSYTITPMAGAVFGQINGVAPGLELTFSYKKFQFVSDSEYVFDFGEEDMDFLYVWSELIYLPKEWFWLGISYQRNRIFDEEVDFQGGGFVGGGYKWFGLTGYIYFGQDNPFGVITLSINYPEN